MVGKKNPKAGGIITRKVEADPKVKASDQFAKSKGKQSF